MERKEFNNIEEAIEALLAIPNIDDIGTDKIKEVEEREFYQNLMNNFLGIKNLTLSDEQKERYKEALRQKGVKRYSDWKAQQPDSDEQVTWRSSVENGTLDAPVNIFSKLLFDKDKDGHDFDFDNIKDLIMKDGKSNVGEEWLKTNEKKIEEIKAVEQTQAEEVIETNAESEMQEKIEEFAKFSNANEAINALLAIPEFKYNKGKELDTVGEQAFYHEIMKNFMGIRDLKFSPEEAQQYQAALKAIGCREKNYIEKCYKDHKIGENVALPVELINGIYSQKGKPSINASLKEIQKRAKEDENVKEWMANADERTEQLQKEEKDKLVPVVPKQKASLWKRVRTRAAIVGTSFLALFGVAKLNLENQDAPQPDKKIEKTTDDKKKVKDTKDMEISIDDDTEIANEINQILGGRTIDPNYAQTPDSHSAETTEANARAYEQAEQDNKAAEEAQKAKEEVAEKPLDVIVEEEAKEQDKEKNESAGVIVEEDGSSQVVNPGEIVDTPTKPAPPVEDGKGSIDVIVGDDGSIQEVSPDDNGGNSVEENIEDDREVIDMEVSFESNAGDYSIAYEAANDGIEDQVEQVDISEAKYVESQNFEESLINDVNSPEQIEENEELTSEEKEKLRQGEDEPSR